MNGINPKTVRIFLTKLSMLGAIGLIFGTGIGKTIDRTSAIEPKPNPENSLFDFANCIKCNIIYPESAQQQGIEGRVEVVFDVDNNGKPINVRLVRSSGYQVLDEALIQQVPNFQLNSTSAGRKDIRLIANFSLQRSQ
ncbi:energy transducer TonB [Scytonema sp. UIC 10036]|uniref:energy transducer TonB n=1 Tax=Scytonema sp. UIC 10036 TaxID=2304196 RepID=UPI00140F6AD9|nr:energy transducer TonB [Scytonema sp. UIC 10036]